MIRLPFAGGLLSPEREFFPKYSAGIYEHNGKKMLVSRGLGSGTFGIRILNRPEIVVITLAHSHM
jgi:predicted MPP superfamily phosphohydrolase